MLDYILNGAPISEATVYDLLVCQQQGVTIQESDPPGTTEGDVLKRIEIELLIRRLGLR